MDKISWTIGDQQKALESGWGIFKSVNGEYIGRATNIPFFKTDNDARRAVKIKARQGDETAKKALEYIKEREPAEFEMIKNMEANG